MAPTEKPRGVRRLLRLAEVFWQIFESTGSVVAYLLYKRFSFL